MKQAKIGFGICLALALGCAVSVCALLEAGTGFPTVWVGWHYLPVGVCAAVALVGSRFAALRPAGFVAAAPRLGVLLCVTGGAFGVAGVAALLKGMDIVNGTLWDGARGVLLLVAAAWLLLRGRDSFAPATAETGLPSAWGSLAGLAAPALVLMERFVLAPPAVSRVGMVLCVLSAMAVLLFLASLAKRFYLPGSPCGQEVYFRGLLVFLLATCAELPYTAVAFFSGAAGAAQLFVALGYGLLGLCGLGAAWVATGPCLPAPPEAPAPQTPGEKKN
ncbi:MAG: hypothetical protein PHO10_01545 [Gemmiger sp.]|nr:hypothetical protein [Gemmiger sp.]